MPRLKRFHFSTERGNRLTHYFFRYPAKFHPPVASELLAQFSAVGDRVLDPFCGSGTLLVEAAVSGRNAVGLDIDPVAAFISRIKTHPYDPIRLSASWSRLAQAVFISQREKVVYEKFQFTDISEKSLCRAIRREELWVPEIPNITHWFRRYVILDLARILFAIEAVSIPATHREFFKLCFAAIIRNASNADPIPVSGLEVTTYMKKRDAAGRIVNPHRLFLRRVTENLAGVEQFARVRKRGARINAKWGDATELTKFIRGQYDIVITSPPYHGAVDYYRRHKLEMYWLKFTQNDDDRLKLLQKYVGRPTVPRGHPYVIGMAPNMDIVRHWETKMRMVTPARADAFKHYTFAMSKFFSQIAAVLPVGKKAVLILGSSSWNGHCIPTAKLFRELACEHFRFSDELYYPVRNHYMSYKRHNGAKIDKEYVLILERT